MISIKKIALSPLAYQIENDQNIALRITRLIEVVQRNPFVGMGKPEELRKEF
jgi:toxin YoeB